MARLRPLADLVDACMGEAMAAKGFAAADILAAWPDIVGPRLAEHSRPARMDWGRRRPEPGAPPEPATLIVQVEGAFALEMQHLAPLVRERLNAHYGWACVGRIVLRQGPVRRAPRERVRTRSLAPAEREKVTAAVDGVADEELRAALARFGEAILSHRPPTREDTKP